MIFQEKFSFRKKEYGYHIQIRVRIMVFNATFNNISVISWQSVLLGEERDCPEKTTVTEQITKQTYHIMLHQGHLT